jgi:hypothetical protein
MLPNCGFKTGVLSSFLAGRQRGEQVFVFSCLWNGGEGGIRAMSDEP